MYTIKRNNGYDRIGGGTSSAAPLLAGREFIGATGICGESQWPLDETSSDGSCSSKIRLDLWMMIIRDCGFHVADFAAAVALVEMGVEDPGLEPTWSTDFPETSRVNLDPAPKRYLDPNYFRADAWITTSSDHIMPYVENHIMKVHGNKGQREVNIALRNGWGELAVVDLTQTGKKVRMSFDYDASPEGEPLTFVMGVKEMMGSTFFMDHGLMADTPELGRLAVRVHIDMGSNVTAEALQCGVAPVPHYFIPGLYRNPSGGLPSFDPALKSNKFG